MEAILNFVIKSGIGLLVLYLFYYALLRNQTSFRFNRLYLLLSPLVALTLPLLPWPSLLSASPGVAKALQTIHLNEMLIVYEANGNSSIFIQYKSPASLAVAIYGLGVLFLLLRLCRQLWHIHRLQSEAVAVAQAPGAVRVLQIQQPIASFTFLNYIFLSHQERLSQREKQQVLAHELAHAQLGHTYDVLYYELLSAVLWFHPFIWLLKQELRTLHEFQADARVLDQHQPHEYLTLLSKEVLFNMELPVGSYFQKPQVLRRLYMLQQRGKRAGWLRPLLALPLLALLMFSLSSQPMADTAPSPVAPTSPSVTDLPPQRAAGTKAAAQVDQAADTAPYDYVEEMPQFKGGEAEMMKFLGSNIRYPSDAREAKTEGLVVVSFVVTADGTLDDVQVLKSLSTSTDAEALRVVQQMNGKWEPGRQNGEIVPVRYTLPIRFAIN